MDLEEPGGNQGTWGPPAAPPWIGASHLPGLWSLISFSNSADSFLMLKTIWKMRTEAPSAKRVTPQGTNEKHLLFSREINQSRRESDQNSECLAVASSHAFCRLWLPRGSN